MINAIGHPGTSAYPMISMSRRYPIPQEAGMETALAKMIRRETGRESPA